MMLSLFRYPIRVVIFKKYGNTLKPVFDRARYEKRAIKTDHGVIESSYLILKREKVKIPPPPISFYYDIEDTRYLYLLQVDRHTYYPISFEGGNIVVKVPVYVTDKKGNVVKDEKGNPKITYVEKTLFDSHIVLEDGKIVELPGMIAHKTYDKERWLSTEIELASRLYRSKGFWERYGNVVGMAVIGILLVMMLYAGATKYTEMARIMTDGLREVAQSLNVVADKLLQATRAVATGQIENLTATTPPY
jgi:hypothetical protein